MVLNQYGLSVYYEKSIYNNTVATYQLAFSPAMTIIELTGEVEGETYNFLEGTDFELDGLTNSIRWLSLGLQPDHLSDFYISYTFFPSLETLMMGVFDRIKATRPDLNTNIGSAAYTFIASLMSPLEDLWVYLLQFQEQAYVDTAAGAYLDAIAILLGAVRDAPTKAFGEVTFTSDTAAPANIQIPMGTNLSTRISSSKLAQYYQTSETVILLQGNTTVDAEIEAMQEGEIGNAGANTITTMVNVLAGISSVTNVEPISGGFNLESDTSFRFRIQEQLAMLGKGTHQAVKLICESIDGIKEAVVQDYNDDNNIAPGECDVLLIGDVRLSETDAPFLAAKALMMQDDNLPAGIHMVFEAVEFVYIDLAVAASLTLDVGATAQAAYNIATQNLTAYINGGTDNRGVRYNGFTLGQDLYRNQIIAKILDVPEITNVDDFVVTMTTVREPHTYTTANEEVLLDLSDDATNCDIISVVGIYNSTPETPFVKNTDWEVKKVTSGDTTLYVKWLGTGHHPDTASVYYVTYSVQEDDDPIVVGAAQMLRVGELTFT
jgi:hypothetical protein